MGAAKTPMGWGHLIAVIDCHDREIASFEFALTRPVPRKPSGPLRKLVWRFGTLRPDCATVGGAQRQRLDLPVAAVPRGLVAIIGFGSSS
jgi:hypothetical protein